MTSQLERLALERHLRIGERSRVVLRILDSATAPLSVNDIYRRTRTDRAPISLATIRRTLNQLTTTGLLRRQYRPSQKPHYEKIYHAHRESLIDSITGQRLEFRSEGIEGLLKHAVQQLGYRLLDYRLELFGVPKQKFVAGSAYRGANRSRAPRKRGADAAVGDARSLAARPSALMLHFVTVSFTITIWIIRNSRLRYM